MNEYQIHKQCANVSPLIKITYEHTYELVWTNANPHNDTHEHMKKY